MSRAFDDVPTLRSTPTSSPSSRMRRKSFARRLERCCCQSITYFPLLFVHGLTGWAVWVAVNVAMLQTNSAAAYAQASLVTLLYLLANVSYLVAVFTSPGSPLDERIDLSHRYGSGSAAGYEGLPTYERTDRGSHFDSAQFGPMTTVTAKSSGQPRYCKKCKTVKPDRAHHCSTCGRCVLKMDHHCPWLATCVGLRNYKPFLLFLIYTSLFCWVCFIYAGRWMWAEILDNVQLDEGMKVVNIILLAVLGGIIGLVLSGFTGWHIYLTMTGQTTIESLEKTRYLTALQKSLESQPQRGRTYLADEPDPQSALHSLGDQLKQIHANALPGVLRPEEGESNIESGSNSARASPSPAQDHLRRSYASLEAQRDWNRYSAYLDEKDSERLPNAFNVGWKRNLTQVMGRQPWFWFVPVLNSCGDGWQWDISQEWQDARDRIARERAQRGSQQSGNRGFHGPTGRIATEPNWKWQAGQGFVSRNAPGPQPHGDVELSDAHSVPMKSVSGHRTNEPGASHLGNVNASEPPRAESVSTTANWNDVPEDFIRPASSNSHITRGRSTAPSGKGKGD